MIPALKEIQAAVKRIAPYVHNTPVLTSSTIDAMLKATVYFNFRSWRSIVYDCHCQWLIIC